MFKICKWSKKHKESSGTKSGTDDFKHPHSPSSASRQTCKYHLSPRCLGRTGLCEERRRGFAPGMSPCYCCWVVNRVSHPLTTPSPYFPFKLYLVRTGLISQLKFFLRLSERRIDRKSQSLRSKVNELNLRPLCHPVSRPS